MYRAKRGLLAILIVSSLSVMLIGCNSEKGREYEQVDNREVTKILERISVDSIEANIRTLVSFHTRHSGSVTDNDTIGIGAARRWIYDKFKQYRKYSDNRLQITYDRYTETDNKHFAKPTEIVNIVGILPGTQLESKDRIYVVSAHYDSRVSDVMNDSSYAPGANDNATGTAAVMELARVMSKREFDATIIFMAVAGEAQGLLGAKHYAQKAREQNMNIAAMFNNDRIGNTVKESDGSVHDDEVRVFAQGIPDADTLSERQKRMLATGGGNDTPSRQLGRFIHSVAEKHLPHLRVRVIYRKDCYLRTGDQAAFLEQGYPAVRFSEAYEQYERQQVDVHKKNDVQYGDLPRFVDYSYVGKVTRLNAASLVTLANAPARPRKARIALSTLNHNTTLTWESNREPDIKGYEVVWRATTKPFWEHSKFVGDTTRYTIEGVSKDDHLFGLRSVDQYGYRSPAVYPLPDRD